jgi:hypothetical protein
LAVDPDQFTAISLPAKIIKLLVADATNAYMNEQLPVEDAESGDEEVLLFVGLEQKPILNLLYLI